MLNLYHPSWTNPQLSPIITNGLIVTLRSEMFLTIHNLPLVVVIHVVFMFSTHVKGLIVSGTCSKVKVNVNLQQRCPWQPTSLMWGLGSISSLSGQRQKSVVYTDSSGLPQSKVHIDLNTRPWLMLIRWVQFHYIALMCTHQTSMSSYLSTNQ